ncbi:unnamed protein product, partial [marine sediment metagenome]
MIKEYWNNLLSGDSKGFDHKKFFELFREMLKEKVALHGLLTLEDYIQYLSKYYDWDNLQPYVYKSEHTDVNFTLEDIKKVLFEPRYKIYRLMYLENEKYKNLLKLYQDLEKPEGSFVTLMERCLHAEHNSGRIIGLDIEK